MALFITEVPFKKGSQFQIQTRPTDTSGCEYYLSKKYWNEKAGEWFDTTSKPIGKEEAIKILSSMGLSLK